MKHHNKHEQPKYTREKKFVAVLAAAGALGSAALTSCYSIESSVRVGGPDGQSVSIDDFENGIIPVPERPANLNADNASPDEFFSDRYFTDEERVKWAYEQLNQPSVDPKYEGMTILEASHAELVQMYNEPDGYEYIRELVDPSENMTGDQIETLGASVSNLLVKSNLPRDIRVKMLAAVNDNHSPNLDEVIELVKNRDVQAMSGATAVNISSANNRPIESPVFRHYVLSNGYDPAGTPSKIQDIMETTIVPSKRLQVIYQFVDGKPVLVKNYLWSDTSKRIDNIQDIPYEPR